MSIFTNFVKSLPKLESLQFFFLFFEQKSIYGILIILTFICQNLTEKTKKEMTLQKIKNLIHIIELCYTLIK
jgi:hypothetical protein